MVGLNRHVGSNPTLSAIDLIVCRENVTDFPRDVRQRAGMRVIDCAVRSRPRQHFDATADWASSREWADSADLLASRR